MPQPDMRNVRPPLSRWRYWAVWSLVVAGGVVISVFAARGLRPLRSGDASLFVIIALMLVLEAGPLIRGRVERPHTVTLASTMMFVFALLLHWGLAVAIIGLSAGTLLEAVLNRKEITRIIVGLALFAVTLGSAQLALMAFGQAATMDKAGVIGAATLPALFAAFIVGIATNTLVVGTLDSVKFSTPWWHEVTLGLGLDPLNDAAATALSPLVVLAAERSPWLVPLLLIPLLAVYRSSLASAALAHQAGHDALTGLPNRTFLLERAHDVLSEPPDKQSVGLFVLDLDRFKEINDSLGHQAGDRLLAMIANRLAASVRPGDLVARLGGDEFAVLLPDVADAAAARAVAGRITQALRAPMHIDSITLNVESSLGVAMAPEHGRDFETLLQRADLAMYAAKGRGTSFETYSADLVSGSASRLNLIGDLRIALDGEPGTELLLHYQPQVSLDSRRLVGVEALLRWQHPVRGLVSPDTFIGEIEQTALMSALTHRVIDEALAQVARWGEVGLFVRVAVNVSVTDLHREEFAGYIAFQLRHHRVDPCWLQLEITERALIVDPGRALTTLHALARLGVSLSLDDFGTGYSSMSQLHRLPVEEIKIDRSFISRMETDVDDRTIVRSIIELGHALGLRVVAEGVEDETTWDRLSEMGSDDAQGWHISKALPEYAMTAWLQQSNRLWPPIAVLPDLPDLEIEIDLARDPTEHGLRSEGR